jgi:hypothetical protein
MVRKKVIKLLKMAVISYNNGDYFAPNELHTIMRDIDNFLLNHHYYTKTELNKSAKENQ